VNSDSPPAKATFADIEEPPFAVQVGDAACGSDVELARLVLQRMRHEQTLAAFGDADVRYPTISMRSGLPDYRPLAARSTAARIVCASWSVAGL
jgi:hypothetical protein